MNELGWDVSEWHALVRRVARLSHRSDAEDLLHTAYIRYRDRKDDTKVGNLNAFLIRTAVNLGIDEHRREQRRRQECLESISDVRGCEKSPAQDEAVAHRQALFRVSSELSRLNPRTSEILMMHRFDGLTYSEIAAKLKITPSAVEKHIAKAMAVLTQAIERE